MQVRVILDHPYSVWTNLDFIKGKVVLSVPSFTGNISSIVVKLEGEARTKLTPPPRPEYPDEVPKPRIEIHKILYKVTQVFPNAESIQGGLPQNGIPARGGFTFTAGQYEYPFQFKLPFNNDCLNVPVKPTSLKVLVSDGPREPSHHVKKTLPPSLNSFPSEADVRYFVKATVNRREFYKENPRYIVPFNFIPIEPPRPAQTTAENYARRLHQFPSTVPQRKGLFGDLKRANTAGAAAASESPSISVDARLPNPAILTCNSNIPLRILIKRQNTSKERMFLESLHIQLIGHTTLTAHDATETKHTVWVILSLANMGILLATAQGNAEGEELVVDHKAWSNRALPENVAPSFETCNIRRRYELEIKVGIGYGRDFRKTSMVFPLLLPVQIYSGISPPASLLAAMANRPPPTPARPTVTTSFSSNAPASQQQTPVSPSIYHTPTTPVAGPSTLNQAPAPAVPNPTFQAFQPTGPDEPTQALVEDPPPSYEDAIAQDLPPIDGPRAAYQPPPQATGPAADAAFGGKGGRGRG